MIYVDVLPEAVSYPLTVGERLAEIKERLAAQHVGLDALEASVWGKTVSDEYCVCPGDRVVFTRALIADPKTVRAHRVDNKPRKGWVARVSKYALSQLREQAVKACVVLLCLPVLAMATEESEVTLVAEASKAEQVVANARGYLGVPYKYGGNTPEQGFDCSGLVRFVFEQVGKALPRTAKGQAETGEKIALEALEVGDLVFFNTRKFAFSHVGIYLGEGQFLHAPARKGAVNIERIDVAYWKKRFNGARRITF